MVKAFRFRLEPMPGVARELRRIAGCCRFVFNRALALQKERLGRNDKRLGYAAACRELTRWRHASETSFLLRAPIHPLQQALRDLDRAYRKYFGGKAQAPRFKRKGRHAAFRFPDRTQFELDDRTGRVKLPKLGWIPYRRSRAVAGTPKEVIVSAEAGHWFVSIHAEQEMTTPVHPSESVAGIDVGVAKFAALSTGQVFSQTTRFRDHERKVAREQRKLARKVRFSRNWKKQSARIERLHGRVARARNDFLHKTSTIICKTHAVIVIEDLSVVEMTRRPVAPRYGPRVRKRLNRSILDQGWAEFRRQLEYKQLWRGGRVIAVDPRHTSRRCSACGHVAAENRPSQAVFRCVRCGHAADADVNAARNILAAGHAVIACGGQRSEAVP